jgi:hypothetical protein
MGDLSMVMTNLVLWNSSGREACYAKFIPRSQNLRQVGFSDDDDNLQFGINGAICG